MTNQLLIYFSLLYLAMPIADSFAASATDKTESKEFYQDLERGWYFFDEMAPKEKEPQLKDKQQPILPTQSLRDKSNDEVLAILEGVQKEVQARAARFSLEPSIDTARDFLEYQQAIFNNGTKASESMQAAILKYPYLDSRIENPIDQQAIKLKYFEDEQKNEKKIKEFAEHFELLYFYKTSCSYCNQFQPVLERVKSKYNFKMAYISVDGSKLEGIRTINNPALVAKLQVTSTPTIIAFNKQNNIYVPIARGFMPESDLVRNIVFVYDNITKLAMGAR